MYVSSVGFSQVSRSHLYSPPQQIASSPTTISFNSPSSYYYMATNNAALPPVSPEQYRQALNSAAMHFTTPSTSPTTANTIDVGRPAGEETNTPVGGDGDIRNPDFEVAKTPSAYVEGVGAKAAQGLREKQGEIIPTADSNIIDLVRQGSPEQEGESKKPPAQEVEAAFTDNTPLTVP